MVVNVLVLVMILSTLRIRRVRQCAAGCRRLVPPTAQLQKANRHTHIHIHIYLHMCMRAYAG